MEQIIFWLAGAFGVPLVNALKKAFNIEGKAAVWLTAAVSAVLALVAVLFTSSNSGGEFTPERLFAAFGQVLAAATLAYKLLTKGA
jgi:drug/metabolite transporter superfamily protein YnfA